MLVLHIIPALGPGGPTRTLAAFFEHAAALHPDVRHVVAVLTRTVHMPLAFRMRATGAEIVRAPTKADLHDRIAAADVVLVHFWNTPPLWRTLAADMPAARYAIWAHIFGVHRPQVLNARVLARAAAVALTSPPPARLLPQLQHAPVIPAMVDWRRTRTVTPEAHPGFNADYIGTTNTGKIHPRFVSMMARIAIPDLRVRVFGGPLEPAMAQAIDTGSAPERFDIGGFVEDIGAVLRTSDIYAYPLAPWTYASCDVSLQEAMLAGVPPVILPHGGIVRFVQSGENGIVARSEDAFVEAIEYLYRHPEQRLRMARNARASAEAMFDPASHSASLVEVLRHARSLPEGKLLPGVAESVPSATLFLISQDWEEGEATSAVRAWLAGETERLTAYGRELPDEAFRLEGGVLQWRNASPDDALLRVWTAHWLARSGRAGEATREMAAARTLGAPPGAFADTAHSDV